jgi:hypothetical protein
MYFETQLLPSLQGVRGGGGSRFRIFETLIAQLGPIIALAAVFLLVNRWRWRVDTVDGRRAGVFCLLVAVSGSLPVGLSPRQSGHYLLPSFPLYAIGIALLIGPIVAHWVERFRTHPLAIRIWNGLGAVAMIAVLLYSISIFGQIGRDKDLIKDVWQIEKIVGTEKTLSTCSDLSREWIIHGYFCRYGGVEIDPSEKRRQFFVTQSSACKDWIVPDYHRVATDTKILFLFERELGEEPIGGR